MKTEEMEKENNKEQNIMRIFISKQSEAALGEILEQVNMGFEAGRVTRSDVANHVLLQFRRELSDERIQQIRSQHFDVVTQMESLLKKIKAGEKVPQAVLDAISGSYVGLNIPSKKAKKTLNIESIKDRHIESEAA